MKPEKYTLKEFWFDPVINFTRDFWRAFLGHFGWWHCCKCDGFFSPRVKKYGHALFNFGGYRCSLCNKEIEERKEKAS